MKPFLMLFLAASILLSGCEKTQEKPGMDATVDIKKSIRLSFEARKEKVDDVYDTPIPGLYEVVIGGKSLFTDKSVSHFVTGEMYEIDTRKNLTAKRLISTLPLDSAIITVNGNGKRKIITLEDPNCGYCRKLYSELKQVQDVTIYTFIIPILGEDSLHKTKNILCSKKPSESWAKWLSEQALDDFPSECDPMAKIETNMNIARKLGVRGTPYLMFENGEILNGYVSAGRINAILAH